jgi:hypothetical protein
LSFIGSVQELCGSSRSFVTETALFA